MFNFFSATGIGVPLAAEPVLNFGPIAITNSMVLGLFTALAVLTLFGIAASRTTVKPSSKFAFFMETLVELAIKTAEDNLGSRKKALKHLPLLLTLFTFILISNLSGLIPGVGTINVGTAEGTVPLFRAFTTDLNATLGLALLTIGTVQFYALKELGLKKHFQHYFTNKPWNPLNFILGLNEVMGEFIRFITLSMRLFGVIYAGEVLLHVVGQLSGNYAWAATFPIYLLEIFFSLIQAYLFVMLTTVYLAMATHTDDSHDTEPVHSPSVNQPKTVGSL